MWPSQDFQEILSHCQLLQNSSLVKKCKTKKKLYYRSRQNSYCFRLLGAYSNSPHPNILGNMEKGTTVTGRIRLRRGLSVAAQLTLKWAAVQQTQRNHRTPWNGKETRTSKRTDKASVLRVRLCKGVIPTMALKTEERASPARSPVRSESKQAFSLRFQQGKQPFRQLEFSPEALGCRTSKHLDNQIRIIKFCSFKPLGAWSFVGKQCPADVNVREILVTTGSQEY